MKIHNNLVAYVSRYGASEHNKILSVLCNPYFTTQALASCVPLPVSRGTCLQAACGVIPCISLMLTCNLRQTALCASNPACFTVSSSESSVAGGNVTQLVTQYGMPRSRSNFPFPPESVTHSETPTTTSRIYRPHALPIQIKPSQFVDSPFLSNPYPPTPLPPPYPCSLRICPLPSLSSTSLPTPAP